MPRNVYCFHPSRLSWVMGKRGRISAAFTVIPLDVTAPGRPDWCLPAVVVAEFDRYPLQWIENIGPEGDNWRIIYILDEPRPPADLLASPRVFAMLPTRSSRVALERAIERAFESLESAEERRETRQEISRISADREALIEIGIALSAERNTEALLGLILTKSREITVSDAGSLYLVEQARDGAKQLVFKLTQNDTHDIPVAECTLPIDKESIAGYAAATGEILNIPDAYDIQHLPFHQNRDIDRRFNYRAKSMLVVPMKNQQDEVLGVLQLINAKRQAGVKLPTDEAVEKEVIPFSQRSQNLAASLASQAAVALEIQKLFEGFVRASIKAIEARDKFTVGHSESVARLTVRLAEVVDRTASGPYAGTHFSPEDIEELRYAALLHDFGKVIVPEDVLLKSKKLYLHKPSLELIRERFLYARKAVEAASLQKKLDCVLRCASPGYAEPFAQIDAERDRDLHRLDEFLQTIVAANEPSVLTDEVSRQLAEIASNTIGDGTRPSEPLLSAEELRLLCIPQGTLANDEREKIEKHVKHGCDFLEEIPWTKELQDIPKIVKAHHWKLDGSGYPAREKKDEDFPLQAKMMAICDIYDALTASDRPYRPAVSRARALDIIQDEVKSNLLDPALFDLFVEAKVYEVVRH